MNREDWCIKFARAATKQFVAAGHPLPEKIRMSIGFTSSGRRGKRIGECWSSESSKDKTFEIFVVPSIDDASRIADILTHELVHAAVGLKAKHGKVFKKCAIALGLEGKMTATHGGAEWKKWATPILEKLGPLPHARLDTMVSLRTPSESENRHIKCECGECGTIFRMSRKTIDAIGEKLRCPTQRCAGEIGVD